MGLRKGVKNVAIYCAIDFKYYSSILKNPYPAYQQSVQFIAIGLKRRNKEASLQAIVIYLASGWKDIVSKLVTTLVLPSISDKLPQLAYCCPDLIIRRGMFSDSFFLLELNQTRDDVSMISIEKNVLKHYRDFCFVEY